MSKTRRDKLNHRRKAWTECLKAHNRYPDITDVWREFESECPRSRRPNQAWLTNKKVTDRRLRHKAKDALRHGNYERVYRKWNGRKKIKTGYAR